MKPRKKLGESRNQCAGCHEYFNSNTAFDKHRTGDHGVNRRCMTTEEMQAAGMSLNKDEFWVASKMSDSLIEKRKEQKHERS